MGMSAAIIPSVLMAQTANKQPNIVLILADDMGRECLGCYGQCLSNTKP